MDKPKNKPYMKYPGNVSKNLKSLKINTVDEATITLTNQHIPFHVKFIASLGPKFSYITHPQNIPGQDIAVLFEKTLTSCTNFESLFLATIDINNVRRELTTESLPTSTYTNAQKYIDILKSRTQKFLKENRSIIICQADKGKKSVIMEKSQYHHGMLQHIEDNIIEGNYIRCHNLTIHIVGRHAENIYKMIINDINPYLQQDKDSYLPDTCKPLRAEPFIIPLLYGCPKVHKLEVPMRPIVSSIDAMASELSRWVLKKLQILAKVFSKYNVKNSDSMVTIIDNLILKDDHHLVLFDYSSMFTNINIQETIDIIKENYHHIQECTSVPVHLFIKALNFFTVDSAYYQYDGTIYWQCRGLSMGNMLAQVLAEIRTNVALIKSVSDFSTQKISFIFKFVDDIFAAMHKDSINDFHETMHENMRGMNLVRTDENECKEVEYLDCIFTRNESDNTISYRWTKKDYSSLIILNFHSNHPEHVKRNILTEMIKHAFHVTSVIFLPKTRDLLETIFKNSSYPYQYYTTMIDDYLNDRNYHAERIQKPENLDETTNPQNTMQEKKRSANYVSCPYYRPLVERLNVMIKSHDVPVKLALSPVSTNRNSVFSKLKDMRTNSSIINASFKMRCLDCSYEQTLFTESWDIERTIEHNILWPKSKINTHLLNHPTHKFDMVPVSVRKFRSKTVVNVLRSKNEA